MQRKRHTAHRTEFPVILPNRCTSGLNGSPVDDEDIAGRPSPKRFIVYHTLSTKLWDVGCQVWPASLLLADWVVHTQKHEGNSCPLKTVLELGAGVGLPSLVAASCGADVLLTDINLPALELAERSLQANDAWIKPRGGNVKIRQLDWTEGETVFKEIAKEGERSGPSPCTTDDPLDGFQMTHSEWRQALSSEVVLAADVLYDDHITDSFCKFLRSYLQAASKWRYHSSDKLQSTHESMSHDRHCTSGPRVIVTAEKRYVFTIEYAAVRAPAFERFMEHVHLVTNKQGSEGGSCGVTCLPETRRGGRQAELMGRFVDVDAIDQAVMGTRRSGDLVLMEVWLSDSC